PPAPWYRCHRALASSLVRNADVCDHSGLAAGARAARAFLSSDHGDLHESGARPRHGGGGAQPWGAVVTGIDPTDERLIDEFLETKATIQSVHTRRRHRTNVRNF